MESGAGQSPSRRLRVNLPDLTESFDDSSWQRSACLDVDTGEVIWITEDVRQELEAIHAALPEEASEGEALRAAFAAVVEQGDSPEWMQELLHEADAVEGGLGTRFVRFPDADSREAYEDMTAFIETVAGARLREQLSVAIRGRGAFRRFKDVLAARADERERWFVFRDGRLLDRVLAWLAEESVEPIEEAE